MVFWLNKPYFRFVFKSEHMSTDNTNSQKQGKEDEGKTKVDEGNAPYPFYVIEDTLPRTKLIAEHFGIDSPPAKRKDVCTLLGKAEPTLMPFFGTAFQYGTLESIPAKGIVVKELYQDIAEGKKTALLEAFANPPLYRRLIQEYNNKILPNEAGLAKLLSTKEYGINSNSATRAAKIFFENGKSLDVIDSNNRLRYIIPNNLSNSKTEDIVEEAEVTKPKKSANNHSRSESDDETMFELPIDLGTSTAYLKYPRTINSSEIAIMKIMLDASLAALQARQQQTEKKKAAEAASEE